MIIEHWDSKLNVWISMNQIFIEWSVCGPGWNTLGHEKGRLLSELPRAHVVLGKSRHYGVKKKSKSTRNATMRHDELSEDVRKV